MSFDQEIYDERKKEINSFLEFMNCLERDERTKDEHGSTLEKIFHSQEEAACLTYQFIINILKSNVTLMIYNLIEYTVVALIDSIYDKIRADQLSYKDVNDFIKALWRRKILKSVKDPNANFNTLLKRCEYLISSILNNEIIELDPQETLPSGNLDEDAILKTFGLHGIQVEKDISKKREDVFGSIRHSRNELAHGYVAFKDAVPELTINDIRENKKLVVDFLDELIGIILKYNIEQKCKVLDTKNKTLK